MIAIQKLLLGLRVQLAKDTSLVLSLVVPQNIARKWQLSHRDLSPQSFGNRALSEHYCTRCTFSEMSQTFTKCWWRHLTSIGYPHHGNKYANKPEMWPCVTLASAISHQWKQSALQRANLSGQQASCCGHHSKWLFLKLSSIKQKVNPRQLKNHEVTLLPIAITKHNRIWPAQQVSRESLARYLSFQQRCFSFFQKCCRLKQTGQIVVEMLRECQSAKCQKDFY